MCARSYYCRLPHILNYRIPTLIIPRVGEPYFAFREGGMASEKIEEKCSNIEKGNIDRCSGLYNNEDKDYMKRLYNESELIIINNS